MGFFQNAYDFEVNGGTFYDIRGNQTNNTHDNSMAFGGSHNTVDISPDISQHDNRTSNQYEQQYTSYAGPANSQPSTYPGYGQTLPTQFQSPPVPPNVDPQDYERYQRWAQWYQYHQYQQYQYQHYHYYMQQQSQQNPGSSTPSSSNPEATQQQPSQTPTSPTTHQPSATHHPASAQHPRPLSEEAVEDPEVEFINVRLEQQHIGDQYDYAHARASSSAGVHMYNQSTTYA